MCVEGASNQSKWEETRESEMNKEEEGRVRVYISKKERKKQSLIGSVYNLTKLAHKQKV